VQCSLTTVDTAKRVDVTHVAYGGLSGIKHVVSSLVAESSIIGLRSNVHLYQRGKLPDGFEGEYPGASAVYEHEKRHRIDFQGILILLSQVHRARPNMIVFHSLVPAAVYPLRYPLIRSRSKAIVVQHAPSDELPRLYRMLSWLLLLLYPATVRVGPNSFPRPDSLPAKVASARVFDAPNGVDVPAAVPGSGWPEAAALDEPGGVRSEQRKSVRIGMGGRMSPVKDFSTILGAVASVEPLEVGPIQVVFAGDGPERSRLEAEARSLGLPVEFTGQLPIAAMPDFYRSLDIYVQSSWSESDVSTSILQAFAHGLCVVAASSPGVRDVLADFDPEFVRLFTPGDTAALASILQELACQPSVRAEMAEKGKRFVEANYSARAMARGYLRILARIAPEYTWEREVAG
jgi:glycosyltransferase involved in cell wall biosynthesis